MANINLPQRFKAKIEEDQRLDGIVKTTLSNFGEILTENKLYFFGEYTDHGVKHIENVIGSSDNLIIEETFTSILKNNDIANYVLAVILHDIGMHLNLDGFKYLIDGKFDDVRINELDASTWRELWEDFLTEAKRFSGKELKSIFGDENSIVEIPPFANPGQINEDHKKLIGEFIRRNHPRLAHEISLKGFPGHKECLEFANGLAQKDKNLIGLIARSHGMGLRKCLDYIESNYGKQVRRTPNGIHATYLMILLRLADYIQIDSGRTSRTLLKLKSFSSPISELEHNTHLSIEDIDDKFQDDPERIFVTTSPKDSSMYLKLRNLIKGIQYEFDTSWAVLGELYGNIKDSPEIKYRRISSNLEDEHFLVKQQYLADRFSFKANDEIVKLLIAPLYGNHPSYGIRELLQNSVDACNEREELEKKIYNKLYNPQIKIEIVQESEEYYFIITDNGIGMDVEVIKNYFLSAGASFRKSLEWQKEFVDDEGKTLVRRSGRFGIGILAAFLIGNEIYIQTKKIASNLGFTFHANLNTEQINILKEESIIEGTQIKIKITEKILQLLKPTSEYSNMTKWYQWYTLSSPEVMYLYLNDEVESFKVWNPDINETLPNEWSAIDCLDFNKIMWTYHNRFPASFSCNGIVINADYQSTSAAINLELFRTRPKLSIFDNNAFLPLSLNRNSFTAPLPFNQQLLEDLYKDFIAYFLSATDISNITGKKITLLNQRLNHPGLSIEYARENFSYGFSTYETDYNLGGALYSRIKEVLVCKKGFIINYNYFIRKLGEINCVFLQSEDEDLTSDKIHLDLKDGFINFSDEPLTAIPDYVSAMEAKQWDTESKTILPFNSRIFIKSEKYKYLFKSTTKRVPYWLNDLCKVQFEKNGWTCLKLDNLTYSVITEDFLLNHSNDINFIREYKISCRSEGSKILNDLLDKYIGNDVIIPFSMKERKNKFPLAFKELEGYMKKYV